ncbi:MAG: lipopolysaccharide biosynthesis protein [Pseudomonas palmensis]|uniref:lipopolysaccharide biosynthesis protein n=1 Tax=Pseudomonas palmensis TaxID=2815362 RepID=UPI003D0B0891
MYLMSNVLGALIPLALIPVLTRFLDPVGYGEVAMFQMLVVGLAAFTGLSVHGAASRKYYDVDLDEKEFGCFVGSCMQLLFVTTVGVWGIVFLTRSWLTAWIGLSEQWLMWAVFVSALGFIVNIRLGQWQVRKQAGKYGFLQISQGVLVLLTTLLFVVVLLRGAEGRIQSLIWSGVIVSAVSLYMLRRDGLLVLFSWRPRYIKELVLYGVPLVPHIIGTFLLFFVDRLVIKNQLGLAEAGIYMLAVQLSLVLGLVFDAVNKAYVPWLFERLKIKAPEELKRLVEVTYIYFVILAAVAALSFFIAPFIVDLIAGSKYSSAGEIIGWLVLGQSFKGMYLIVSGYIYYSKRTGLLSLITISTGILNVIFLVFGVSAFGLKGAAMAFSLAMALQFLATWAVAARLYSMPWLFFLERARDENC